MSFADFDGLLTKNILDGCVLIFANDVYFRFRTMASRNRPIQSREQPRRDEHPYIVRLTPEVHSRLLQFFNRTENAGLRQSDIIDHLLTTTDTTSSPERRGQRTQSTTPAKRARQASVGGGSPPRRSARFAAFTADAGTTAGLRSAAAHFAHEPEEGEVDEELLYGDEYVYEDEEDDGSESAEATANILASMPRLDPASVHNYFTGAKKEDVSGAARRTRSVEKR
jgi:hypothetical protein